MCKDSNFKSNSQKKRDASLQLALIIAIVILKVCSVMSACIRHSPTFSMMSMPAFTASMFNGMR